MNIPFYINHGHRCGPTALKSALGAILPERKFSHGYLDNLINRFGEDITFPCQIANALKKLNLKFKYFIRPNWQESLMEENFKEIIKRKYYPYGNQLLEHVNLAVIEECAISLKGEERVIERVEKPDIKELTNILKTGGIPICLINYDVFIGRENQFRGHYIILTEIDREFITYHESGPVGAKPHAKAKISRFMNSWNLCFFDHDLVVVGE